MGKGSTDYVNKLWFRLLPWRLQQKIMARRYHKIMSMPPSEEGRRKAREMTPIRLKRLDDS